MSEVSYHGWTHRPKAQGGTDPIQVSSGLPFACWQSASHNFTAPDANEFRELVDMSGGTFRTNSPLLSKVFDTPSATDYWGIRAPCDKLLQVTVSLYYFDSDPPGGRHWIDWVIGSVYSGSARIYGPSSQATQKSATSDELTDAEGEQGVYRLDHMGRPSDVTYDVWTVGMAHSAIGYTLGPLSFKYEMTVTIMGDIPV